MSGKEHMKQMMIASILVGFGAAFLLFGSAPAGVAPKWEAAAAAPSSRVATQQPHMEQIAGPAEIKAMRELHGVKLGMPRAQVNSALGKPSQTAEQMDEFKLNGGDLLTVRYDPQNSVQVIQLYCTDADRAPAWADVIGDAPIEQQPNGSKHARKEVPSENFWVAMFQSQSGALTTVTLSRQKN
jgi:hypothetical protein